MSDNVAEIAGMRSALIELVAQVARSTSEAPANMSMIEINREWDKMREAALRACRFLQEHPNDR